MLYSLYLRLYRLLTWRIVFYHAGLIVEHAGEKGCYDAGSVAIRCSQYGASTQIKIYLDDMLVFSAARGLDNPRFYIGLEAYRVGPWVRDVIDLGQSIRRDLREQQFSAYQKNFEPLERRKRKNDDI